MQHAREWLAGETCRRTLDYFVDNYGKGTSAGIEVTALVDSTELWFVCVNNPDGYEYTFTPGNRLHRKNLADNDNNGVIDDDDGVDPEPQLLVELGPRQRRLLAASRVRDLPRPVAGVRARDAGHAGAVRRDPPRLPEERPHRGGAAALPAGLPAGHAERRPRDLHRARGRPVQAGHRGLPARAVGGPLHHQRRLHGLGLQHQGHAVLHARGHAGRGPERHGLRVPGLRAADPAGVPPPPAVRARPREVRRRPVRARLAPRQHGRGHHGRHLRRVLRRPAARRRGRQAQARRRLDEVQDQRRPDAGRPDDGLRRRRALLQGPGRLLQARARRRLRHDARRLGRGVVHRRRQGLGALHVHRGGRVQQAGAHPRQRGLVRRAAQRRRRPHRTAVPATTTGRRSTRPA